MPNLPVIVIRRNLRIQAAQVQSMASLLLSAHANTRNPSAESPGRSNPFPSHEDKFHPVAVLPVFSGHPLDLIELTQMALPKPSTALAIVHWKKTGLLAAAQLYHAKLDPTSWTLSSLVVEGSVHTLYRSMLAATKSRKAPSPWIFVVAHLRFQGLVIHSRASQTLRVRVIKGGNTALSDGSWHSVRSIALRLALEDHRHFRAITLSSNLKGSTRERSPK